MTLFLEGYLGIYRHPPSLRGNPRLSMATFIYASVILAMILHMLVRLCN